jgi:hypothetical protein
MRYRKFYRFLGYFDGVLGTLDILNGVTDLSLKMTVCGFLLIFIGYWLCFLTSFYPKKKKGDAK